MRWQPNRSWCVAVLALSLWSLPGRQLLAADPRPQAAPGAAANQTTGEKAVIRDVALAGGGTLRGQVLDAQGQPVRASEVRVAKMGQGERPTILTAQTDAEGRFAIDGLNGGIYGVETEKGVAFYRLWTANAAPPVAKPAALIVEGDPAVRANLGRLSWLGWTLIGLGVAAAIAIPLILQDDDDDAS